MSIDRGDEVILHKAVEFYGSSVQELKAMEELGELIRAIARIRMCNVDESDTAYENLAEEMADVDIMLEQGLEQEVRSLLARGVSPDCQSMQSIGYRQMVWYLNGSLTYDEAVDKLKQATRNFAKRQITWYKKMPYIKWLQLEKQPNYANVVGRICEILVEKGFSL